MSSCYQLTKTECLYIATKVNYGTGDYGTGDWSPFLSAEPTLLYI